MRSGHATSIQVYRKPFIAGYWNWSVTWPGGGQMGTARSEDEAWEKARACLDAHTGRPFAFQHPRRWSR